MLDVTGAKRKHLLVKKSDAETSFYYMGTFDVIETRGDKKLDKEELDAGISVDRYLVTVEYDYPAFHLSMDCFWCSLIEGHVTLLEHEAAKWLPLSNLRQVNWLPADMIVVDAIEAEIQIRNR